MFEMFDWFAPAFNLN